MAKAAAAHFQCEEKNRPEMNTHNEESTYISAANPLSILNRFNSLEIAG
jgi:hypothetical protein